MENEITLGEVYEDISERLALARTKALMGERHEALGIFQGASLEFRRFREVLTDYPGYHALEYAFNATLNTLCAEEEHLEAAERRASRTFQSRRKLRKAA